jgi:hypothetical protein
MSPMMMRQFWSLIDATQSSIPLGLDDGSLVQWLLRQVRALPSFDNREADIFSAYISDRLPLIRDLAQS